MKTIKGLPHFNINKISMKNGSHILEGGFNHLNAVQKGLSYLLTKEHYYYCRLEELDEDSCQGKIESSDDKIVNLMEGQEYPLISAYWTPSLIYAVLEGGCAWNSIDLNSASEIIDHEHCDICDVTIDQSFPVSFKDQYNNYLCKNCYNKYVVNKDISFVFPDDKAAKVERGT